MKEKLIIEIFILYYSAIYFGSIRNRGNGSFWAQEIALRKYMKFKHFIVYLLLKVIKLCKFQQISSIS